MSNDVASDATGVSGPERQLDQLGSGRRRGVMAFPFASPSGGNMNDYYARQFPVGSIVYNNLRKCIGKVLEIIARPYQYNTEESHSGLNYLLRVEVTVPRKLKQERTWPLGGGCSDTLIRIEQFKILQVPGAQAIGCPQGSLIMLTDGGDRSVGIDGGSVIVGTGKLDGYAAQGNPELSITHWIETTKTHSDSEGRVHYTNDEALDEGEGELFEIFPYIWRYCENKQDEEES